MKQLIFDLEGSLTFSEDVIKSINKINQRTEFILKKYPETKGDDTLLIWRYMREFHYDKIRISFKAFKNLLELPAFESITRARRKIQETELQPKERTRNKRKLREIIFRGYYAKC